MPENPVPDYADGAGLLGDAPACSAQSTCLRVVVAGAGVVGRSIARDLLGGGHEVVLIDKRRSVFDSDPVDGARQEVGDACEMSVLARLGVEDTDVVVAATGDDKVNLVVSLLAKTEFAVSRVVARINEPRNEWLFDDRWGVDVEDVEDEQVSALARRELGVAHVVHERGRARDHLRGERAPLVAADRRELLVPGVGRELARRRVEQPLRRRHARR